MFQPPRAAFRTFVLTAALAAGAPSALAAGPAPTRQQQQHEIQYLELVADHHALGVLMAELCEERAASPELQALCAQSASDQTKEIEMVVSWLKDWYGIDYQPDPDGTGRLNRLARLGGPEFDVEFSEEFIKHHARIIRGSAQELGFLYHPEAQALATHIIEAQSMQIEMLREVIASYGVMPPPGLDVPNLPKSR